MSAMFASLTNHNYRRYAGGQAISLVGTWMQTVAQSWLVLQLTHSGTQLGLLVALQTLPVLLLGPYAGVVADRVDKRRLMMGLQAMMGVLALLLGLLTITHSVTLWQADLLAVLLGLNNAFENPARQSFVLEIVGAAHIRNAVGLNSTTANVGRMVGPAVAGIVIAAGGLGFCFILNALSFGAVIISLWRLDTSALHPTPPAARAKGQVRDGLRYVRHTPSLAVPLVIMAVVGCLSYEFQVVLPVVASRTFGSGSQAYGFMTAAMGVGAIVGGLWVAARGRTGIRALTLATAGFGVFLTLAAMAPTLWLELVALVLVGAASVGVLSKGNSTLQVNADPSMSGRVMALWAVAFMGSTPIGGPIAGVASNYLNGRGGLVLAAGGCFLAALFGWLMLRALRLRSRAASRSSADVLAERAAQIGKVGNTVEDVSVGGGLEPVATLAAGTDADDHTRPGIRAGLKIAGGVACGQHTAG